MKWWGKLSHGQQIAIFVPVACAVGVLGLHDLGDSWGRSFVEGIGILLTAVVFSLVVRRQRQGSAKHED